MFYSGFRMKLDCFVPVSDQTELFQANMFGVGVKNKRTRLGVSLATTGVYDANSEGGGHNERWKKRA